MLADGRELARHRHGLGVRLGERLAGPRTCRTRTAVRRLLDEERLGARGDEGDPLRLQALGNPRLAEARASVNATRTAGADTFAATVAPVIAEAQAAGAKSLRQIAAALNGRGIATARGGRWEAQTVANVMRRG